MCLCKYNVKETFLCVLFAGKEEAVTTWSRRSRELCPETYHLRFDTFHRPAWRARAGGKDTPRVVIHLITPGGQTTWTRGQGVEYGAWSAFPGREIQRYGIVLYLALSIEKPLTLTWLPFSFYRKTSYINLVKRDHFFSHCYFFMVFKSHPIFIEKLLKSIWLNETISSFYFISVLQEIQKTLPWVYLLLMTSQNQFPFKYFFMNFSILIVILDNLNTKARYFCGIKDNVRVQEHYNVYISY